MAKRTLLEQLMKKIGDILNVNYRFHRRQNYDAMPKLLQMPKLNIVSKSPLSLRRSATPSNSPRTWQFEWWKRMPGNPLNKYSKNNLCGEEPLPRSKIVFVDIPIDIKTKDEAIEYVLFMSDFLPQEYGSKVTSYDELCNAFGLLGIYDK